MLKDAIKYVMGLAIKPGERFVDVIDGSGEQRIFAVNDEGKISEIKQNISRSRDGLLISTLTGLVDYIKANRERKNAQFFLHVKDARTVILKGLLDSEGLREEIIDVQAIIPEFYYGQFLDAEELIISLQSKFVPTTDDRELLLKVIGNVKEENVRSTGDNGFSQAVTIKTGVASADDVIVPNPVELAPYRTFLEVEQPSSRFIFRMKDGPRGAIFEADGGAWRNQAISNIKGYLEKELAEEIENGKITIIA